MVADTGNFYLATPMEQKEYLRISVDLISKNLWNCTTYIAR